MSPQQVGTTGSEETRNEVVLRGRVAALPEERVLPSGDTVWTLRLVLPRPPVITAGGRRRASVDTIDCAAWSPRVQRSVARWQDGDVVEVAGALRRRFYRAGGVTVSRVEVELVTARRTRRAAPA